jgi:hypothetical protein
MTACLACPLRADPAFSHSSAGTLGIVPGRNDGRWESGRTRSHSANRRVPWHRDCGAARQRPPGPCRSDSESGCQRARVLRGAALSLRGTQGHTSRAPTGQSRTSSASPAKASAGATDAWLASSAGAPSSRYTALAPERSPGAVRRRGRGQGAQGLSAGRGQRATLSAAASPPRASSGARPRGPSTAMRPPGGPRCSPAPVHLWHKSSQRKILAEASRISRKRPAFLAHFSRQPGFGAGLGTMPPHPGQR